MSSGLWRYTVFFLKKKLTAITGLLWNLLCHLIGKGGLFKNIQCSFKLKEPWSQWFSRMCLLSWDDYLSIGQRKVKLSSTRHPCPDKVRKGRKQKLRLAFKLVLWKGPCKFVVFFLFQKEADHFFVCFLLYNYKVCVPLWVGESWVGFLKPVTYSSLSWQVCRPTIVTC